MTNGQFIERLKYTIPEAKDIARADKIVTAYHYAYDRKDKAMLQLRKITDIAKMFRRAKAFINHGIEINFQGCKIFSEMDNHEVNMAIRDMIREQQTTAVHSGLLSL